MPLTGYQALYLYAPTVHAAQVDYEGTGYASLAHGVNAANIAEMQSGSKCIYEMKIIAFYLGPCSAKVGAS